MARARWASINAARISAIRGFQEAVAATAPFPLLVLGGTLPSVMPVFEITKNV
jgi:hypothetical protein